MNIKYYRCNYPSYTLRHYKCRSNQHDNNMGVYFMTMLYLIVTIQMIYAANTADAGRLLNATSGGYGRFFLFFFCYLYFKCMFNAFIETTTWTDSCLQLIVFHLIIVFLIASCYFIIFLFDFIRLTVFFFFFLKPLEQLLETRQLQ